MKTDTNNAKYYSWNKLAGLLLTIAFLFVLAAPVKVNAAINKYGSVAVGGSTAIEGGKMYEIPISASAFYKFTAVAAEEHNEVYFYINPSDEWDYDFGFYSSHEGFIEAGKSYYIKSDYDATITVAAVSIPPLQPRAANQAVKEYEYYSITTPKTSDYVVTFTASNSKYASIELYDETLDNVAYKYNDKGNTVILECLLKANKTYYFQPYNDGIVSISVGEVGSSRDALQQQYASSVAAQKAALAKSTAPKKVAIKSLKAGKKSMLVKWKKVKGISGYELQYGLNKSFTKGQKIIKVKKTKISRKITKLTSKKKYYVRIRAYKSITGGTIYGNWSKVKVKKVK